MAAVIALLGCHPHDDDHAHGAQAGEAPVVSYTHFTERTELFVEFPPLVVGQESPFAAHFTWIDREHFKPVEEGRVTVRLTGGGADEIFLADGPARPGIFRPVAVPKLAGARRLTLELHAGSARLRHDLGEVRVHANANEIAAEAPGEETGHVTFLKEQQWQVEFAYAPIQRRRLQESMPATGSVRSRHGGYGGEAQIDAPADGVLAASSAGFARVGQAVRAGQTLAVVGGVPVLSPLSGSLVQVYAAPGAQVLRGQPLFHVVDLARLWLEVQVPEADVARLSRPSGAWFRAEGTERIVEIRVGRGGARLVSFSGTVDPRTRTVPLVFEFASPGPDLRLGQSIPVQVYTGRAAEALAVPAAAVVDDGGGRDVVYVLADGEHFERRAVELGIRDGGFIEVRRGLSEGERVVTRGAYLVRLAASAPAAAGHGHAH
jgi:biotin carboxyl carrier protein